MPQGPFPAPQVPELPPGGNPSAAIVDHPLTEGRIEAPIYDRARLSAGDHIDGPAIIT